jgi:hypothetical protein
MKGGANVGRSVAAVAALFGVLAIVTYFVNPFGSPLN